MSYDFYGYRSADGQLNTEEARRIIGSEENATFRDDLQAREIREKIAAALMKHDPRMDHVAFSIPHW